ncbi:hypothetical protein QBC47DRAFT_462777 [Echria macrotheca]|uniref:Uncharacterized protein n=1 Tax=Echria macrotheca TaxID=438768 RepID=A0AAJ0BAD7_9PEZI|nr:hypothetical protein QBC47DRAFT_462777 [Echria macrotheca]
MDNMSKPPACNTEAADTWDPYNDEEHPPQQQPAQPAQPAQQPAPDSAYEEDEGDEDEDEEEEYEYDENGILTAKKVLVDRVSLPASFGQQQESQQNRASQRSSRGTGTGVAKKAEVTGEGEGEGVGEGETAGTTAVEQSGGEAPTSEEAPAAAAESAIAAAEGGDGGAAPDTDTIKAADGDKSAAATKKTVSRPVKKRKVDDGDEDYVDDGDEEEEGAAEGDTNEDGTRRANPKRGGDERKKKRKRGGGGSATEGGKEGDDDGGRKRDDNIRGNNRKGKEAGINPDETETETETEIDTGPREGGAKKVRVEEAGEEVEGDDEVVGAAVAVLGLRGGLAGERELHQDMDLDSSDGEEENHHREQDHHDSLHQHEHHHEQQQHLHPHRPQPRPNEPSPPSSSTVQAQAKNLSPIPGMVAAHRLYFPAAAAAPDTTRIHRAPQAQPQPSHQKKKKEQNHGLLSEASSSGESSPILQIWDDYSEGEGAGFGLPPLPPRATTTLSLINPQIPGYLRIWPARPGTVYCLDCIPDDLRRWLKIRDGFVSILSQLMDLDIDMDMNKISRAIQAVIDSMPLAVYGRGGITHNIGVVPGASSRVETYKPPLAMRGVLVPVFESLEGGRIVDWDVVDDQHDEENDDDENVAGQVNMQRWGDAVFLAVLYRFVREEVLGHHKKSGLHDILAGLAAEMGVSREEVRTLIMAVDLEYRTSFFGVPAGQPGESANDEASRWQFDRELMLAHQVFNSRVPLGEDNLPIVPPPPTGFEFGFDRELEKLALRYAKAWKEEAPARIERKKRENRAKLDALVGALRREGWVVPPAAAEEEDVVLQKIEELRAAAEESQKKRGKRKKKNDKDVLPCTYCTARELQAAESEAVAAQEQQDGEQTKKKRGRPKKVQKPWITRDQLLEKPWVFSLVKTFGYDEQRAAEAEAASAGVDEFLRPVAARPGVVVESSPAPGLRIIADGTAGEVRLVLAQADGVFERISAVLGDGRRQRGEGPAQRLPWFKYCPECE